MAHRLMIYILGGVYLLMPVAQCQSYSVTWEHGLFDLQLPNGVGIDTAYGYYAYTNTGDSLFLQVFAETRSVATDPQGNSIDVSEYQGSYWAFPAIQLQDLLPHGIIINKRNPAGQLVWSRAMKGAFTPIGWSVETDDAGDIFICGHYADSLDVNPDPAVETIIHSAGGFNNNGFVVKLDINGNLLYARNITSTDELTCYDIAIDVHGNQYIVGDFMGTADFDPGTGVASATATGPAENLFVVKLDPQGHYLWHHVSQTSDFSRAYKCAVDPAAAVYICGEFSDQVDFSGTGSDVRNSQGSFDAFVFKLDSAGTFAWARNYGTANFEYIRAMHHNGNHLTIAGYFEQTLNLDQGASNVTVSTSHNWSSYVQHLDAQGNHVWADEVGDGLITINGIGSNALGETILAGRIASEGIFALPGGTDTVTNQGEDLLVVILDSNNHTTWANVWNSPGDDWANDLGVSNSQEVIVGGTFTDQLYLSPPTGSLLYGEGSGYEGLVYKLSKCVATTAMDITACHSYTSPSGRYTWTATGQYVDTVFASGSCDSIFLIDLTLATSPLTSIAATGCDAYASPTGNVYTLSGVYYDTLTNAAACDSVVAIDLTIQHTPDTSTMHLGDSLVALADSAAYQWFSCTPVFQAIPGATNAQFVVSQTGSYAVEVSRAGCADTSFCRSVMIASTGIGERTATTLSVYPNPVEGTAVFVTGQPQTIYHGRLVDAMGKLQWEGAFQGSQSIAVPAVPGVYMLQVYQEGGAIQTVKLVR